MKGDTFTTFFQKKYQLLVTRFLVMMQGIGVNRWPKAPKAGYSSFQVNRSAEAPTHIHAPCTNDRNDST